MMKGTVKVYSSTVNAGVIQCEKGKVYIFRRTDWKHDGLPATEQTVRFEAIDRKAVQVEAE